MNRSVRDKDVIVKRLLYYTNVLVSQSRFLRCSKMVKSRPASSSSGSSILQRGGRECFIENLHEERQKFRGSRQGLCARNSTFKLESCLKTYQRRVYKLLSILQNFMFRYLSAVFMHSLSKYVLASRVSIPLRFYQRRWATVQRLLNKILTFKFYFLLY